MLFLYLCLFHYFLSSTPPLSPFTDFSSHVFMISGLSGGPGFVRIVFTTWILISSLSKSTFIYPIAQKRRQGGWLHCTLLHLIPLENFLLRRNKILSQFSTFARGIIYFLGGKTNCDSWEWQSLNEWNDSYVENKKINSATWFWSGEENNSSPVHCIGNRCSFFRKAIKWNDCTYKVSMWAVNLQ